MTQFEKLLNETNTLEEALTLHPCLADGKAEWYIEEIRYTFIAKKFGINPSSAIILNLLLEKFKRETFEKAFAKYPLADMVSMCVRQGG